MGDSANTEKAPKAHFWKGLKAEFKKITWPDRESLLKQSVAVVSISIALGIVIGVLDKIIQLGVNVLTM